MNEETEEKTSSNQQDGSESLNTEEGENLKSEELDKNFKSALAQKEHFKAKFEEAQARIAELENKKVDNSVSETKDKVSQGTDPLEMADLVSSLMEYSSEERREIKAYARGKGISIQEATQSEFIKNAIAKGREKVDAENKIPGTTNRGSSQQVEDLSQIKDEDLKKNWDIVTRKAIESGKRKKRKSLGL